jgi:hypothetical protein
MDALGDGDRLIFISHAASVLALLIADFSE